MNRSHISNPSEEIMKRVINFEGNEYLLKRLEADIHNGVSINDKIISILLK
jgi:hypothetical protein